MVQHLGYRTVVIGAHVAFLVSCGVTVLYPTVWTAVGMTTMAGVYFSLNCWSTFLMQSFPITRYILGTHSVASTALYKYWLYSGVIQVEVLAHLPCM